MFSTYHLYDYLCRTRLSGVVWMEVDGHLEVLTHAVNQVNVMFNNFLSVRYFVVN